MGRSLTRLMVQKPMQVALETTVVDDPGPRQVLIRNDYTVMNLGTEMTIFTGDFPQGSWWDRHIKYPNWEGWGCLGTVIAVGGEVTGIEVGDKVVGDGAHGNYYLAAIDNPDHPQRIGKGITDEQAGLWSLSRVSLHGIRVARLQIGEAVVILGQGIIGQLALRFARLAGAFPVIAVDISPERLELSARGGATYTLQGPVDQFLDEIPRLNKGRPVDCVIEATGNPQSIPFALQLPRQRGRVIILGSPRGISNVDFHDQIHFGVDVIGAQWTTYPQVETPLTPWTTARNGELFLDLVRAGELNVDGLIGHTFNWREAPEIYKRVRDDRTQFMAVRFDWRDCPDQ